MDNSFYKKPTREEFLTDLTERYCKEGMMLPLINESYYRQKILLEKFHYPDEVFMYFREIGEKVINEVDNTLKEYGNINKLKDGFVINYKTPYFDSVNFVANKTESDEIKNSFYYAARYYGSDGLMYGKLVNPNISLTIPFNHEGKTNTRWLMHPVCHELTHIYDDWVSYIHSGKSVVQRDFGEGNLNLRRAYNKKEPVQLKQMIGIINDLIYVTRQTERTAFISSAFQEFYDMGMTDNNCKEMIPRTVYYKNLQIAIANCRNKFNQANTEELIMLNNDLKTGEYGKKLSAPRINKKEIDPEEYRRMLINWSEKLYASAMKMLYTAAWYYTTEYRHQLSDTVMLEETEPLYF